MHDLDLALATALIATLWGAVTRWLAGPKRDDPAAAFDPADIERAVREQVRFAAGQLNNGAHRPRRPAQGPMNPRGSVDLGRPAGVRLLDQTDR